jgi:hypothetical protein
MNWTLVEGIKKRIQEFHASAQGKAILRAIGTGLKWGSIPVLLIASLLFQSVPGYGFLFDVLVCLGAVVVIRRAAQLRHYYWAALFIAVAVVFSPVVLLVKIFLLMGFTSIVALATALAGLSSQTLRARLL